MGVPEQKNECNRKYAYLLELLRTKGDWNDIHRLLIEVAESLVSIGNAESKLRETSREKAIYMIKIAKSVTPKSSHFDVYSRLTGIKVDKTSSVLESVSRDLEDLEKQSRTKNWTSSTEIPDVSKVPVPDDEKGIRPLSLREYIGQKKIVAQVEEAIKAAKLKQEPLEHILLFGNAGLGKTSLSKIIANEMNQRIIIMSGPTIKDPMSMVAVVKEIQEGDILFIDEIHRISTSAAEAIYTVMEDFELSYVEKDREGSRNVTLKLPRFTVIGATTHSGLLEKPMRDRFAYHFKMDLYSVEDLIKIAIQSTLQLGKTIDADAAENVAKRSRGVPRICNSYIKRLVDKALVGGLDNIDLPLTNQFFGMIHVDQNGLNETDLQYLKTIQEKFGNRPIGIDNLASCLGEGKDIIESQIEPYLLYLGLIQITPGGRMLTNNGIEYVENN